MRKLKRHYYEPKANKKQKKSSLKTLNIKIITKLFIKNTNFKDQKLKYFNKLPEV